EPADATLTIWPGRDTRTLTSPAPAPHPRLIAASRSLTNRRWERISAGELRWCGVLFPTPAHAQDAGMSLTDYEQFVYRACHTDDGGNPVAHWQATQDELAQRAEDLSRARELRVVGPDTDLRVMIEV